MRNVVVIRVLIFSLFIVGINALTDQENHRHDKLLSRHRRYLTFPEGSSLQLGNGLLVYDQIIGIIDFTNIHIFGVTVSLAWQLPHKTAFADEEHKGMHNNKISISQVDTDKIDKNVPSKDMSKHNYYFESYFNRSNYHSHQMDNDYYAYLNWKKTISKPPSNRQFDDWKTYRSNKTQWDYSHKIYPALRMRRQIAQKKHMNPSQTSSMHPEVHQLVKYHRDSRFSLFKSIEKYLNAKGEHGEHCIKRAICETMQIGKTQDDHSSHEPDAFFRELLRVIFSLPSAKFQPNTNDSVNKYDVVVNEIEHDNGIDCSSKYSQCSTSIWSQGFSF